MHSEAQIALLGRTEDDSGGGGGFVKQAISKQLSS